MQFVAQINFIPSPILVEFAGISIRYYGFFIAMSVLIALFITNREAIKQKLNPEIAFDVVLYGAVTGIIGARILHVLSNFKYYISNPAKIVAVWNGGLSLHGGLIIGIITLIYYLKLRKVNIWKYLDLLAPAMILAQAIGRWGNFFNQEAFGLPTSLPWGIYIEKFYRPVSYIDYSYFHPTFLYESLWNILIFILLISLRHKKYIKTGEITLIYLIGYSIGRFFIEFLRLDSVYVSSFKLEQILSIAIIIISVMIFYYRRKGIKKTKPKTTIKRKINKKK